jgi:hypothetical protein
MSSKNLPVSINLFPTLDYIELVQFNEKAGEIDKTAALPCVFDQATRQILDIDHFTQTIRDLYSVTGIPTNTHTVLTLPGFFTREIDLPAEFSRDELRFALVSEAERFYAFKKIEPHVDWIKLSTDRILYSAFVKSEIEKYAKVFQELKIPLLGVDLSYFSLLRGLLTTGILSNDIISKPEPWCLITLSNSSMFITSMEALKISKTLEVRLSLDSEDGGVIQEIQQDFADFSEDLTFSKVFIINNSNVESQQVLIALSISAELVLVEQNASTLSSRGASSPLYPCTLEAIGGVFYSRFAELPSMNFLPQSNADIAAIGKYQADAMKWLLIGNCSIFVLLMMIWGILNVVLWQKTEEVKQIGQQAGSLSINATPETLNTMERKKFIKKAVDTNVKINNLLVSVGKVLPKDTWLDRVEVTSETLQTPVVVNLEGKTLQLDTVNHIVPELNAQLNSADAPLEVSSASQGNSTDGQAFFTWSIQNKKTGADATAAGGKPPQ